MTYPTTPAALEITLCGNNEVLRGALGLGLEATYDAETICEEYLTRAIDALEHLPFMGEVLVSHIYGDWHGKRWTWHHGTWAGSWDAPTAAQEEAIRAAIDGAEKAALAEHEVKS